MCEVSIYRTFHNENAELLAITALFFFVCDSWFYQGKNFGATS